MKSLSTTIGLMACIGTETSNVSVKKLSSSIFSPLISTNLCPTGFYYIQFSFSPSLRAEYRPRLVVVLPSFIRVAAIKILWYFYFWASLIVSESLGPSNSDCMSIMINISYGLRMFLMSSLRALSGVGYSRSWSMA